MKNNMVKIASLFSGIGGFEEGIRQSGINADYVFESEIDVYAQKSYSANFDSLYMNGDITKIEAKEVPEHDFLVAGFPCQSFSIAGERKGFEDTRGTLFFDVVRILNVKKPKYIFLENVKNLVSHDNGNTIKTIINNLSNLGYTVDFTIIDAKEAGVPQSRNRTYIVGIYNYPVEKYEKDKRTSKITDLKKYFNEDNINSFNFFNNLVFNNRHIYLEDILEKDISDKYFFNKEKVIDYLNKLDVKDIDVNKPEIVKLFDLPRDVHNDLERQRRVYSIKGISPTVLARTDSTKILVELDGKYRIRKITPFENFYVQGFSKKFVENIKNVGMSEARLYKQSGNAVSPPVIAGIVKLLFEKYYE